MRCSSRSRVLSWKARMVSFISTVSGMTLEASPPWMLPTVTTAVSSGATLRETTVCSAITVAALATMGSTALSGTAPCPP